MARLNRFSPQPTGKDSRTSGQCWGHSSSTCSCLSSHLNSSLAVSPPSNLGPEAPTHLLQPSPPILPAGDVLDASRERHIPRCPPHSRQAATAPRRALGGGAWLLLCAQSCSWHSAFPCKVYSSLTPAREKLQRCLQFGFRKHYWILLGWGEGGWWQEERNF